MYLIFNLFINQVDIVGVYVESSSKSNELPIFITFTRYEKVFYLDFQEVYIA